MSSTRPLPILVLCILGVFLTVAIGANEKPNVLVILADDLGYSDVGFQGGEIETPHLDRLADNGLVFSQFYNALGAAQRGRVS